MTNRSFVLLSIALLDRTSFGNFNRVKQVNRKVIEQESNRTGKRKEIGANRH